MTQIKRRLLGLSAAMAIAVNPLLAVGAANAADFLDDPETPVTEVEYGTGWYLRGDIGFTHHETVRLSEQSTPIAGTTVQRIEDTDTNNVFNYGVGVGYRFSPNFRMDLGYTTLAESEARIRSVTTDYRPPCSDAFRRVFIPDGFGGQIQAVEGGQTITNCVEENSSSYFVSALMLNGYFDLNTNVGGLQPYLSFGGGVVRNQYTSNRGDITCTASEERRCNPTDGGIADFGETYTQQGSRNNGTSYHAGLSIGAGFAYEIAENLFLDTSYSYTRMLDDPLWGSSNGIADAGVPTDFHTVRVGLRYQIW